MRLGSRVERIEGWVREREGRRMAERLAQEHGISVAEVLEHSRQVADELAGYRATGLTLEEALEQFARDAGVGPEELQAEIEAAKEAQS